MKQFEISEEVLNRLLDLANQNPRTESTPLEDYCNCTGFGG